MRTRQKLPLRLLLGSVLLASESALAQLYLGINYIGMDYQQPNVRNATQPESNPPFNFTEAAEGSYRAEPFTDLDLRLTGVNLKLGYSLTDWLGIECRSGFGAGTAILKDYTESLDMTTGAGLNTIDPATGELIDPSRPENSLYTTYITETTPVDAEMQLKYAIGGYFRFGGNFRGAQWISPYVLLGYTRANFDIVAIGGEGGGTVGSHSTGGGFNIKLSDNTAVNLEYLDMMDVGSIDVSNWSVGFEYRVD